MPVKKSQVGLKVGLGVAAAAAAAGAYYFFGKNGAKNRKAVTVWAVRAKKDVVTQVKKLKTVNAKTYAQVTNRVLAKYKKFQKDNPEIYALLSKELKTYWPKIAKHLPKTT